MPFKSEKQRKWMHANEPEMAKKWEKKEKKMRMGTRYGMSDGGPAVMASMENQKPN